MSVSMSMFITDARGQGLHLVWVVYAVRRICECGTAIKSVYRHKVGNKPDRHFENAVLWYKTWSR